VNNFDCLQSLFSITCTLTIRFHLLFETIFHSYSHQNTRRSNDWSHTEKDESIQPSKCESSGKTQKEYRDRPDNLPDFFTRTSLNSDHFFGNLRCHFCWIIVIKPRGIFLKYRFEVLDLDFELNILCKHWQTRHLEPWNKQYSKTNVKHHECLRF